MVTAIKTLEGKMLRLLERWHALVKEEKDLQYKKSVLSKEMRDEFPIGAIGEAQCISWCQYELNLNAAQAKEFILRGDAVRILPDPAQFNQVGFAEIVRTINLPKKEQVATLQMALYSHRTVKVIMEARGTAPKSEPKESTTTQLRIAEKATVIAKIDAQKAEAKAREEEAAREEAEARALKTKEELRKREAFYAREKEKEAERSAILKEKQKQNDIAMAEAKKKAAVAEKEKLSEHEQLLELVKYLKALSTLRTVQLPAKIEAIVNQHTQIHEKKKHA